MEQNNPIRISVVLPAYNAAATIGRALDSCLSQSLPPFEIIVVDDGSSDTTWKVLEPYGNAVSLLSFKENKGPAAARNAGIRTAKGNFIAFLDADDYWHADKLKIVSEVLRKRPEAGFLYHDFTLQMPASLPVSEAIHQTYFSRLLLGNPMATPCVIVRNQEQLRFDESLRFMEDYALWLRLAGQQKVWHLPLPLTVLGRPVLSAGGQSSNRWRMRKGELNVYTRLALHRKAFLPLLPLLWMYSLAKHFRKML